FHVARGPARRQRMLDVRAVVKPRQVAQQTKPSDRPPANKFDQTIGGIGLRSDKHGSAGVFAIVESKEKRAPLVPLLVFIAAQRERPTVQLRHAHEYAKQIS